MAPADQTTTSVKKRRLGYRGEQVLEIIKRSVDRDGTPPSYAAIASALGMTVPDVCNVVRRLERRGVLHRRAVTIRKNRGWHRPVIVLVE